MDKLEFEYKNVARLAQEYVEAKECSCARGVKCWKCIFLYNLNHLNFERLKDKVANL